MPYSQMTASLALPPSWSQATTTHSLRRVGTPFLLRQSLSVWPHVLASPRGRRLLCGTQAVIIRRGILVSDKTSDYSVAAQSASVMGAQPVSVPFWTHLTQASVAPLGHGHSNAFVPR